MKKFVEILYFICAFSGAVLVALNVGLQLPGYILFLISSVAGSYLVLISNASRTLLWVNLMFMVINFIGIVRA